MKKLLSVFTVALLLAWCLLVLLSWFLSATMAGESVRSMLSSEGIRHFFAHIVDGVCQPLLVWILMAAASAGCVIKSRLTPLCNPRQLLSSKNTRKALQIAAVALTLYVVVILLLTAIPRALLLSATGTLYNSPFSRAFIPIVCFGLLLFSVVYGLVTRSFTSFHDVVQSIVWGISNSAPYLLVYLLACQLYNSFCYVFMLY